MLFDEEFGQNRTTITNEGKRVPGYKGIVLPKGSDWDEPENQPIPLRRVPSIAGWSVIGMLDILTTHFRDKYYLLQVHSLRNIGEEYPQADVSVEDLLSVREQAARFDTRPQQIEAIPEIYFVWSDELYRAFYHLHSHLTNEHDRTLNWNMDTPGYTDLINACPDFASLLNSGGKRPGRPSKSERDEQICQAYQRIKAADPALSRRKIEEAMRSDRKLKTLIKWIKSARLYDIFSKKCSKAK